MVLMHSLDMCKPPYTILSKFYDLLVNPKQYSAWHKLIEKSVKTYMPRKCKKVLDLACGTGRMTVLLAQDGYFVFAVDVSSQMLNKAKANIKSAGLTQRVKFLRQNMLDLNIKSKVDLAICFYDSLNYLLKKKQLKTVFQKVYNILNPNGLFIFDINTLEHVRVAKKFDKKAYNVGDGELIFEYGGRGEFWKIKISYIKKGKLIGEEEHVERGYDPVEISNLLRNRGFQIKSTLDAQFRVCDLESIKSPRVYFVCQKGTS